MIRDTVAFLRAEGRRVFLDAEHFFDGYRHDRAYASRRVRAAAEAGAEVVALCDTNGGMLPPQVADVVARRASPRPAPRLGIHCHNDTGCAVANTPGRGRCRCRPRAGHPERLRRAHRQRRPARGRREPRAQARPAGAARPAGCAEATRIAHAVSEITNVPPYSRQPYVGASAFAHKAGLHASAIKVDPDLYQHTDPTRVGNDMRMLVSDMAGRASIELKGRELGFDLAGDQDELLTRITDRVKALEAAGYTFEAADASFELLLREELDGARPAYFDVESWRVITESRPGGDAVSEATVKLVGRRAGGSSRWGRATARSTPWTPHCARPCCRSTPSSTSSS